MNDILKQEESLIFKIILKIIKFLAWVYLAILLFTAISLPFYNYILVPLDKKITSDVSKYLESELIQAYNLDIDPTVKESFEIVTITTFTISGLTLLNLLIYKNYDG